MVNIECPNCQKTLDLSFVISQKKLEKNPTTCHICNRPYDKVEMEATYRPKRKRNRSPNPQSNEPLPKKTKEEILLLKKKKEIILSGETKICTKCKSPKPIERYCSQKTARGNSYKVTMCIDCMNAYSRARYPSIKERQKLKGKEYRSKEEVKAAVAERVRQTRKENPEYYKALRAFNSQKPEVRLARSVRKRLLEFLKTQSSRVSGFMGCTGQELKQHFESKFQQGMSWDNYGYGKDKWVIDHIKPICLFDRLDKDDLKRASHYSNLQPLWYFQNEAKSNNYDPDHPMGWHGLDALIEN